MNSKTDNTDFANPVSPAMPAPARRRRTRRQALFDAAVLALVFLSAGLGMFLFGAVRVWSIGPLVALVFFAALMFFVRPRSLEYRGLRFPGALFPGLVLLLYLLIHLFTASSVPYEARVKVLMILGGAVALFLWIQLGGSARRASWFIGAGLILVSMVCWYAYIQHQQGFHFKVWMYDNLYGDRVGGSYVCPNHFANLAAMGLCVAVFLLVSPGVNPLLKVLSAYLVLVGSYPLLLSQSRAGLLGFGAGLGAGLLVMAWRRSYRWLLLALVAVPLLLGAAGWLVWTKSPKLQSRFMEMVRGLDSGQDWRLMNYRNTLEMIRQKPWIGYGGNSFRWIEPQYQNYSPEHTALYTHNEFLQLAMEYGLVGGGLIVLTIGSIGVFLLRHVRRTRSPRAAALLTAAAAAGTAHIVHGLFDYNWHIYANTSFLLMILGVAVAAVYEETDLKPRILNPRQGRFLAWTGGAVALALLILVIQVLISYTLGFPAETARGENPPDAARAERLYRTALTVDPGAWESRLGLGRLYAAGALWDKDKANRARVQLETAARGNPYEPEIWFHLGQTLFALGEKGKAAEAMKQATIVTPKRAWFHTQYGLLLRKIRHDVEALPAFESALKLDPTDRLAKLNIEALKAKRLQKKPPVPGQETEKKNP